MRCTFPFIAAATLALSLAGGAFAATDTGGPYHTDKMGCRDAQSHLVAAAKCAAPATPAAAGAPNCKKGKPCGKACIAMDKVCHIK